MYYYPVRSKLFKQLEQQVSLSHINNESFSIFDNTSHSIRCEENVRAITTKLCDMHVFDSAGDNRSLQTMDGHLATPEQCSDLLTFRDIGQSYYSAYVKHYILRDPSRGGSRGGAEGARAPPPWGHTFHNAYSHT